MVGSVDRRGPKVWPPHSPHFNCLGILEKGDFPDKLQTRDTLMWRIMDATVRMLNSLSRT